MDGKSGWIAILRHPKLIYAEETGTLVMLAADPKEYRLLAKAKVIDRTWSSLALSDGCAFVRDDFGQLKCLDLRK